MVSTNGDMTVWIFLHYVHRCCDEDAAEETKSYGTETS